MTTSIKIFSFFFREYIFHGYARVFLSITIVVDASIFRERCIAVTVLIADPERSSYRCREYKISF